MEDWLVEGVWVAVFERVGADLRGVVRYDGAGFESRMRDDVRALYTRDDDWAMVDDTIIKQLGLPNTEAVFNTGSLQALVRVFDDAWVLSWADTLPGKSGLIISIDRNGAATMKDVDWCIEFLIREITPQLSERSNVPPSVQ